jgi:hypothetical protein
MVCRVSNLLYSMLPKRLREKAETSVCSDGESSSLIWGDGGMYGNMMWPTCVHNLTEEEMLFRRWNPGLQTAGKASGARMQTQHKIIGTWRFGSRGINK